ncbi:MAG TPA: helix-turn-helix domain-containing protein [Candidatus Saccharimonadales bacterium]|nr:helix-turn-helix domain-containing protein [Candidatus Saccharimonadales bacterium]
MDITSLTAVGLTAHQAEAYASLLEAGSIRPPELAQSMKITRTNAYKLLDKLTELKLAVRSESSNKAVYVAANPMALTNLTAGFRAEAVAREEAMNTIIHDLLAQYHSHSDKPDVEVFTGRKEVAAAYRKQLNFRENIHFIHTRADVPSMGFDTMHEIRVTPSRHGNQRHAIMTAPQDETSINYAQHKRSNLDITWASPEQYDAPVEWSVTNSSLLIVLYATEPHAVLIVDTIVAGAFMQLWRLLSTLLQMQPMHKKLSHAA